MRKGRCALHLGLTGWRPVSFSSAAKGRRNEVKQVSLGEGESEGWISDVGVSVRLQAMISDQMKKITLNTQKTPTAQNQHTYVQGG